MSSRCKKTYPPPIPLTVPIPSTRSSPNPGMKADKLLFAVFSLSFISLLAFLSAISGLTASSFLLSLQSPPSATAALRRGTHHLPSFAYYISGGREDRRRLLRLLLAVYHPRNRYLLHLTPDARQSERTELAVAVQRALPASRAFGNVDVLGKPDAATHMGSSGLAATLHAASVLLQLDGGWDWFVTMSAADYPLLTQDDLIHVFSFAPRDLNFIDHTSDLGWKDYHRVQPIIVDPGIYLARKTKIFFATERRTTPDAFKFFTGSPLFILSRSFLQYCILGWDNLPRTLLMYFTNVQLSQEGYFHSVICNSPEFQNTTVNSDLRYMLWDVPPQMEPHFLNETDYTEMVESGNPFARQFHGDDPVLDRIDDQMIGRPRYRSVLGAWCSARGRMWTDPCSKWGDVNVVKPGPRARKFKRLMEKLLDDWKSQLNSCK